MAAAHELTGLSITDHDTIEAYLSGLHLNTPSNLQLLAGVELSTQYERTPVHVLGYSFDIQNAQLQSLCTEQQQNKLNRNLLILDKLRKLDMDISYEALQARFEPQRNIGRPHIAQYLFEQKFVSSTAEAFKKYLGNTSRCFVKGEFISTEEAINVIQNAGGYAVIAHPHMMKKPKVMRALLTLPFDGIEAYYGKLPKERHSPWIRAAEKNNWFTTGGSDYHGIEGEYKYLGSSLTPASIFEKLVQRFKQNNRIITSQPHPLSSAPLE
tara:strand:+ start:22061 stop:22864 length:804 start_codon:yes stop_codon:yes gene_type:complete